MKKYILLTLIAISQYGISFAQPAETGCVSGNCVNGKGKYVFDNNSVYEGSFVDSKIEGFGKYTEASGISYSGNFSGGKRNGFGTITWPDGSNVYGTWTNDVIGGKVTANYSTGERYVGDMKDYKREGKGIHYNADGSVYHDGFWKNNEIVTQQVNNFFGSVNDGNFCKTLKQVIAESEKGFPTVKGALISEEGEYFKTSTYRSNVIIPGTTVCDVKDIFGLYYTANFGTYVNLADAQKKYDEVEPAVRKCMSDKMFVLTEDKEKNSKTLTFKTKYKDGFDLYGDALQLYASSEGYVVSISVSAHSGFSTNHRLYTISSDKGSGDATFDANIKKILSSAPDEFNAIKGQYHEEESYFGNNSWNELTTPLTGISDLKWADEMFSKGVSGKHFSGFDSTAALNAYKKLAEKVKKSLGPGYCYYNYTYSNGRNVEIRFCKIEDISESNAAIVQVKYYMSSDLKVDVTFKVTNTYFTSLML
ncbi:MAG: hypothetical protein H7321_10475 [Bacteroidia bacterium]|nr:hypothetical protein [Bacteroidia bacterium]